MGAYTRVAYVSQPKSLNGWVVCHAADGFPFALEKDLLVHFVPPSLQGPRQARVCDVRKVREGTWEVSFEGIQTIEAAQDISGCVCLAAEEDVHIQAEDASSSRTRMVGYTLVEAKLGPIGTIVAVQAGSAQDLLVVETDNGEVLVPAVDAFLGPLNHETRSVHATLPDGLLDLNIHTDSAPVSSKQE